jgi:hypothetical protein
MSNTYKTVAKNKNKNTNDEDVKNKKEELFLLQKLGTRGGIIRYFDRIKDLVLNADYEVSQEFFEAFVKQLSNIHYYHDQKAHVKDIRSPEKLYCYTFLFKNHQSLGDF